MEGVRPQVGIGVLARHPITKYLLIGKRTTTHGNGTYSFPGGHLEYGEDFGACAARELMEETNLTFQEYVDDLKPVATLNNIFRDTQKHYVTILMEGTIANPDELRNMEPEKCESWEWVSEEQIRDWAQNGGRKMFMPIVQYYKHNAT